MFRKVSDFLEQWAQETDKTFILLDRLPDESLMYKVTPEGRSLGVLAWHLVTTPGEMAYRAGLANSSDLETMPVPSGVAEICRLYHQEAGNVQCAVQEKWSDKDLTDVVNMYGELWPKGMVLWSLIVHQAHHRGQITVLMRQAGLIVPGIYGPSREEWIQMGMTPQV